MRNAATKSRLAGEKVLWVRWHSNSAAVCLRQNTTTAKQILCAAWQQAPKDCLAKKKKRERKGQKVSYLLCSTECSAPSFVSFGFCQSHVCLFFSVRREQIVVKTGQMSTRHFTSSQRRVESQRMATSPWPAGMRQSGKVVTFVLFGPLAFALVHSRNKSHPHANRFGSTITDLIDSGTKQV